MKPTTVLVVVPDPANMPPAPAGLRFVSLSDTLRGAPAALDPSVSVLNLCPSERALSPGYYASLLADARGQAVEPDVDTLRALQDPFSVFRGLREAGVATLDPEEQRTRGAQDRPMLQRGGGPSYTPARDEELAELLVLGGVAEPPRFRQLARQVHAVWPHPMLRLKLAREQRRWKVYALEALRLDGLSEAQVLRLLNARHEAPPAEASGGYSLAVLFNEEDDSRPSDLDTLNRLARVGERLGVNVERLGLDALPRLGEFDALFIRTLTGMEEPAYGFAQRAESIGMPVIDDTASMLRCGNKVHLHALMQRAGLATPPSLVVDGESDYDAVVAELGAPFVLKLPDGSFSRGVRKVDSPERFEALRGDWLQRSPLLIAQAWRPSDFDWRVAVLDGRPLFTCRYHMARGHWQIAKESGARTTYGRVEAVPRETAPPDVVALACAAAALMGEGLYGVDLKETADGPVVIEINDNPNLDTGYEDGADGDLVYEDILGWFARRLQGESYKLRPAPTRPVALPAALRAPIEAPAAPTPYAAWSVVGLELEYAVVDDNLEPVGRVADTMRALHGRPCSEVELGVVGISNEIVDHVLELKTFLPLTSLVDSERVLAEGVRRAGQTLAERSGARLLPTGMHPWFDPRGARIWSRSGRRIYATYARLFDVHTHGWANVQACHVNLPFGSDEQAVAMMNAAAMLVPYLPALAASSPIYDGALQPSADSRLAFILTHQLRVPESLGRLVPEPITSMADYKARVLQPMYEAVDRLPDAGLLRREYFNARGAVFKASRASMEVRVLDVQECVKADAAIAAFTRGALRWLVESGVAAPEHALLVADLEACVAEGGQAQVQAPHLLSKPGPVRAVLERLIEGASAHMLPEEHAYLPVLIGITENGTLSERIRAQLAPVSERPLMLRAATRELYGELSECLLRNQLWGGRS